MENLDTDRIVLEGVPPVGFYPNMQQREDSRMRCPEDVPWPSCLRACLEYLGDGLGCRKIGLCTGWGCVGGHGHGDDKVRNLADPDVRRQIVSILQEARDLDAEAADHIERALA